MKKRIFFSIFAVALIYAAVSEIVVAPVESLSSADVNSVVVTSKGDILTATESAGLQISTDGGTTFRNLGGPFSNQTLNNNNFRSLYADGPNIYAGGSGFFNSPGLQVSTDGGNNFEFKGLEGVNINDMIPYNSGVLVATNGQGVQFFNNNTLSTFGAGLENFNVKALYYESDIEDVVLAATDIDLYKYDNASQTWSSTLLFLVGNDFARGSGNNTYMAANVGIYESSDLTNFNILPTLDLGVAYNINTIAYSEPYLYMGINPLDLNSDLPPVHRLNTITNTWEDYSSGLPPNAGLPKDIVINNGSNYLGTSTGFYKGAIGFFKGTINGEWEDPVEKLTAGKISYVGYNPFNNNFYAGGSEGDLHVASEINGDWTKNDWGLTLASEIKDIAFSPTRTMVVQLTKLWAQEIVGDRFEIRNNGVAGIWYTSIACNPSNNVTVLGTYNGLFYSTDFGEQWQQTNENEFIWKVGYSSTRDKFFAITLSDLLHSDGDGQNFETAATNITPIDFAIEDDPLEFKIGVSTNNNFLEFDENFNSIELSYAGLPQGGIIEKVAHSTTYGTWVGSYKNKFYGWNPNASIWDEEASIEPRIRDVTVILASLSKNSNASGDDIILIGTLGGGLYSNAAATDVDIEVKQLITGYKLSQNYPNPFNPSTKIKFSIPNVERFAESLSNNNERIGNSLYNVTLKVYDVLGNEVATLVNEEKPAGTYEVDFNASQFTSGVYFYKIQAGKFIQTKKMVLLK